MTPRVSVIIPTYNRASFITAAIASVRAQRFADWELIVIDDRSTDATGDILAALAREEPRLVAIANDHVLGCAGARNAGLARARGELIAFLDSDDVWLPGALGDLLAAFERDPAIDLAAGDAELVDHAQGRRQTARDFLFDVMVPWWETMALARAAIPCAAMRADPAAIAGRDAVVGQVLGGFLWIQATAVMIRRASILACGGFDEALARTEDWDLWLKLNQHGRFAAVDAIISINDITGRGDGRGPRYDGHDAMRRHDAYQERLWHLRLLRRLAAGPLSRAQAAFARDRIGALHRKAAFHAPTRRLTARHSVAAFWHRPAELRALLNDPRHYFSWPG